MNSTIGITDMVEAMHKRVVHPPFLPSTPVQHLITDIASIGYKGVRFGTRLIGGGFDKVVGQLENALGEIKNTDKKEAFSSALNGVVGDYLEETENPLQITMQFRHLSQAIEMDPKSIDDAYPSINGKILLMVHGSCMNDLQWTREDHNHGMALADELGLTPIYLHYNTGRHVSSNGQSLNELLEDLVLNWTVPIEELHIIAHSMGGLVSRSAIHYSQEQNNSWTNHLKKIIFLGTPHQGAPLERMGNYVDNILESIPYAKPFARLGKLRSAGITDLRYGSIVDEDWEDIDRFEITRNQRNNISLCTNIEYYNIAAAIGKKSDRLSHKTIGDNLVDIKSALGKHKNPNQNLAFKLKNNWVIYENNHLDLLSNLQVYDKIKCWLKE